jgi:hypothetical protein
MKLRHFSTKYFDKPYFTYESYLKRYRVLKRSQNDPTTLTEFIAANRSLQIHLSTPSNNFLNIQLTPSNSKLENQLWTLLNKNQFFKSLSVVKTYFNTNPRPTSVAKCFDVTTKNFEYQLRHNPKNIDTSGVTNCLNLLLDQKDYYNGFKLIDLTVNSAKYIKTKKRWLHFSLGKLIIFNVGISTAVSLYLSAAPAIFWILLHAFGSGLCFAGIINLQAIKSVGRLSWRPYNGKLYNYLHTQEMLLVNRIINHFEEHNEVNIKNFHHSKVRSQPNLNVFEDHEFILELPGNSTELVETNTIESRQEQHINDLQQFFRSQLNQRKLVLGDLREELMFLEFWLTNGENFVWVEPDQDPAEIVKLEIEHGPKIGTP